MEGAGRFEEVAVRPEIFSKDFRFETGDLTHGLRDTRQNLERKMAATGIRRGPGRRVNLHKWDLRAVCFQFFQSQSVMFDFFERRFFAVNRREQALNDDRALSPYQEDVRENLFEWNIQPIDFIQVCLCASVEFDPDFVGLRKKLEPLLNVCLVKPRAVCEQHEFEKREAAERPHVHDGLNCFHKIRRKGRFAVTAQGDVAQLKQFVRKRSIPWTLAQAAFTNESQRPLHLSRHDFDIEMFFVGRLVTMNLAVDAIEVALLVRIHVDADGEPASSRGDDDVNEPVVQIVSRTTKRGFVSQTLVRQNAAPLVGMFGCLDRMLSCFFHNAGTTLVLEALRHYTMLVKRCTFFARIRAN